MLARLFKNYGSSSSRASMTSSSSSSSSTVKNSPSTTPTLPPPKKSYVSLSAEEKKKASKVLDQCRETRPDWRKKIEEIAINYDHPLAQAWLAREHQTLSYSPNCDIRFRNKQLSLLWARRSLEHSDAVYVSLGAEMHGELHLTIYSTYVQKNKDSSLLYLLATYSKEEICNKHPEMHASLKTDMNAAAKAAQPSLIAYIIELANSNNPEVFKIKMNTLLRYVKRDTLLSFYNYHLKPHIQEHIKNNGIKIREASPTLSPLVLIATIISYDFSWIIADYFEKLTAPPPLYLELKPLPQPTKPYASLSEDEKKHLNIAYDNSSYFSCSNFIDDYPPAQARFASLIAFHPESLRPPITGKPLVLAIQAAQWACRSMEHPDTVYSLLRHRYSTVLVFELHEFYHYIAKIIKFHPICNRLLYLLILRTNEVYNNNQFNEPDYLDKWISERNSHLNSAAAEGATSLLEFIMELARNLETFTTKMNALLKDVTPENKLALLGYFESKATDQKLSPFTIFSSEVVPIKPPYDTIIHYLKSATTALTTPNSSSSSSHSMGLTMSRDL